MKKILILQGHPDSSAKHFCHVLEDKYASAAQSAGHLVKHINIATLDFPLLTNKDDFDNGSVCADVRSAQDDILWAEHVVVIHPLWLGDMPAIVKGFFEQVFRPGFAFNETEPGAIYKKRLKGKSARIFVTMGMPAIVYRWFYKAHSVKNLKRNILSFCGFKPVAFKLIGGVHEGNEANLRVDLSMASRLGRRAQ